MNQRLKWTPEQLEEVRRRMARRSAKDGPGSPASTPEPAVATAPRRRSKYGVQPVVVAGVAYDSKAEASYALVLEQLRQGGSVLLYRRQVPVAVVRQPDGTTAFGEIVTKCTLDFEVRFADGSTAYHEVKGVRVRDWPVRERALLAAGVPLVVVSTSRKRRGGGRRSK